MIEDNFANRQGYGPLKAVQRVQQLCHRPSHRLILQLDACNLFNSINHQTIMEQYLPILDQAAISTRRHDALAHLSHAILCHNVTQHAFKISGDRALLASILPHKRLDAAGPGVGLPISSLSSQLFANFMLNPIDHLLKHELKVRGYVRYLDDLLFLANQHETRLEWQQIIAIHLTELKLTPHPSPQQATHGYLLTRIRLFGLSSLPISPTGSSS